MITLRRLTAVLFVFSALATAVPAAAQDSSSRPRFNVPASFAPQDQTRDEQGLGIFIQGGWVRVTQWGGDLFPSADNIKGGIPGYLFGIGFGGNKSGHFGIGADINYYVVNTDATFFGEIFDPDPLTGHLKLHYLQVPVYGRITFFGTSTKNAPSLYALIGGFVDILLKASLQENINVKDSFNGFDVGILAGGGFEAYRIGIEARFHWALRTLQSTGINHNGQNTFLNGLEDSKKLTFVLLFKLRLN
jgi:hypothetical protein